MPRKPTLTIAGILREADAFNERHDHWPQVNHNLEWRRIDSAMRMKNAYLTIILCGNLGRKSETRKRFQAGTVRK